MSPERYAACYSAGRDWAETEAELCGDGPLPDWTPPFASALVLGETSEGAAVVLKAAAESWNALRRHWT